MINKSILSIERNLATEVGSISITEFLLQTVYNGSDVTINKGEVVYVAGAQGNAIVVGEAIASLPHDSEVIGVALENIINGGYGSIVIHGIIDGLNTDSFSEGDRLYLSAASYGQITNVKPSAPNHAVLIGYCVKKDILDGAIYVNVNTGEHLKELHDVNVDSAIGGQYLFLDNDQIWKNKTIEYTDVSGLSGVLSGFYPASNPSGFITGVNLANYITTSQTGAFYAASNPSGFITGIENLVYTTGDQSISGDKIFENLLRVGALEVGLGTQTPTLYMEEGRVGINNENPTSALDVSGLTKFSERPFVNGSGVVLSGEIDTSMFYPRDNPSGYISGDLSLLYPRSNPSGFITGIDTSNFYTNDNPSGFITGVDTSNFYTNNNPSGYITGIQNLVYTTGDQTISGIKTFEQGLEVGSMLDLSTLYVLSGAVGINNENPQAALDVSGSARFSERPFVNGTGILLEGEVQNNTIISGVLYSAQVNIKNNHTGTLYKGQPVYINGAAGGNILVGLASNVAESTSSKTLGLIYQDSLAVDAFGTVITDGLLSNFNVGSAAAGDPIWLGPTGNLIYGLTNKPVAPNHLVYLGVVTKTNNNGEVFVKVQNGYELDELHDVAVKNSPTGQFLFKNIESLWSGKYLQISDVSGLESSLNQKQTAGDYYLNSNPSGFISSNIVGLSGATQLVNIVQITQSGYNTIVSPATGTLYIIVG